jgi:hypothetical protein
VLYTYQYNAVRDNNLNNANNNNCYLSILSLLKNAFSCQGYLASNDSITDEIINWKWWGHAIYLSVCLSVYGSTALCWALSAFQILNPIHSRYDSLNGGSARCKTATYIQNNTTQNKRTYTFMSRLGFEPTTTVFERAKTTTNWHISPILTGDEELWGTRCIKGNDFRKRSDYNNDILSSYLKMLYQLKVCTNISKVRNSNQTSRL